VNAPHIISRESRHTDTRRRHSVCAACILTTILISSQAVATDRIKITADIIVERGLAAQPAALTQAKDGGYVIVGSLAASKSAWAIRVDRNGKFQWRHLVPSDSANDQISGPEYTGAAILPDDSAILCGFKEFEGEEYSETLGLITHISKEGEVISERLIQPEDGKRHTITQLLGCTPLGEDIILLGVTGYPANYPASRQAEQLGWMRALDANANLKWEKIMRHPEPNKITSFSLLSNHDLILASSIYNSATTQIDTVVTHVTAAGVVEEQRLLTGHPLLVRPTVPDLAVRTLSAKQGKASLTTWDKQMRDKHQISGRAMTIASKRTYIQSDGSLVLFGFAATGPNVSGASISWLSHDLSMQTSVLLKPEYASAWVADAVPTGKPGEFAMVRSILPIKHPGKKDQKTGVALTFVQFK
jgi:hypothetical protein